ncbi:C40 family peptidase [Paenibacillus sp. NPDC056579]|uniref:C40 family peptidase n=1 Tax=Paenibacillus sp. NPDC056579 TaxID=3345871 RepID=UPI003690FD60
MRLYGKKRALGILVLSCTAVMISAAVAGCTARKDAIEQPPKSASLQYTGGRTAAGNEGRIGEFIPVHVWDGKEYVTANDLARSLAFRAHWDAIHSKFAMGDYDAAFVWTVDSVQAEKGGGIVTLAEPPVLMNSLFYIPVSALPLMFQDELSFERKGEGILFHSTEDTSEQKADTREAALNPDWDFADDPGDPFKEAEESTVMAGEWAISDPLPSSESAEGTERTGYALPPSRHMEGSRAITAASRLTNINELVTDAKRYLGTGFAFAAPPYPESGQFDCSSFTQYVYARHSLSLADSARGQAVQGEEVSKERLRKGDLLFFHVPGRYLAAHTIGHVGIYAGNGQMLHAAPSPEQGVQLTDIRTPYWKQTFVKAVRVANRK